MKQRTILTGLAVVLLAVQACGSEDGKKKVSASPDAGMGGESGSPEPNTSGGSASGAPMTNPGGAAGSPEVIPEGGTGGTGEIPGNAGMGGVPVIVGMPGSGGDGGAAGAPSPPQPELLFSVKSPAHGLAGTAIAGQTNPSNVIYASSTASQGLVDGTNSVKITGAELGLDPTDEIVAFALLQPKPQHPLYLLTVADGAEGSNGSRVSEAFGGDEEANLYYSDGTQSRREINEGGDEYGYNALLASDVSLGLTPGEAEAYPADDLTGLAAHDARFPITEVYFTVGRSALGVAGSAVSTTTSLERGCTVFKSALDGTNSVAFSCANLALGIGGEAVGDKITGLTLFGTDAPTEVLFSLDAGSSGADGSAVSLVASYDRTQTLFTSPGDGTNAIAKVGRDLGLDEYGYDEIDGFTVVEAPVPSVAHANTCQLSYDPTDTDTGGAITTPGGTSYVGPNTLVYFGQTATPTPRLIAYNATSCAFLQQKDMPVGFENANTLAMVPLAGWSAAKPLDKVEYLRVTSDSTNLSISRYDAAGAFVAAFPINDTTYTDSALSLVYEPQHDRLFMVINNYEYSSRLAILPRPAATDTSLDAAFAPMTVPCGSRFGVLGTDALGNLAVAKTQGADLAKFRVCSYTPSGEVLPQPTWWVSETDNDLPKGFISPSGSYFLLRTGNTPFEIERGIAQAP